MFFSITLEKVFIENITLLINNIFI